MIVECCERSCDLLVFAVFKAFRKDAVGVMDVTGHDILGTFAGCDGETSHLIGSDFTCDLEGFKMHRAWSDLFCRHFSGCIVCWCR